MVRGRGGVVRRRAVADVVVPDQPEVLEELGLVRHNHISDRAPTYHSTAVPDHVHLVCRGCGSITEVAPEIITPMTDILRDQYGFTTDVGHLTVFGMCRGCTSG